MLLRELYDDALAKVEKLIIDDLTFRVRLQNVKTAIDAALNKLLEDAKLVKDALAEDTEIDVEAALRSFNYTPFENLDAQKWKEVSALFYSLNKAETFYGKAEVLAAIDEAIAIYNDLLAAVNSAETIVDTRTALRDVAETYKNAVLILTGDMDGFTTDPLISSDQAERVLDIKMQPFNSFEEVNRGLSIIK
jgi:hypothetical protein